MDVQNYSEEVRMHTLVKFCGQIFDLDPGSHSRARLCVCEGACVYDAILILGAIVVGCGGGSGGRWWSQRVGLIGARATGCLLRSGRHGGSIY